MITRSTTLFRRRVALALLLLIVGIVASTGLLRAAQPPQPPGAGQSEFVPVNELPPEEQLPAAPLLIAAYAFVWIALLGYLWSIWRRLGRVESELSALAKQTAQRRP